MQTDSIELGFLSIFALITFFIFLIIEKYSKNIKDGILLDKDFIKPQAFHEEPISRSGGLGCIVSLIFIIVFYYILYNQILYEYLSFIFVQLWSVLFRFIMLP